MELKNTEKQEHSVVALTIEITKAEFEAAKDKAFKKTGKNITVPGFRKGKAPRKMIEKLYGEGVFFEEAFNIIYPDAMEMAVEKSGIKPVGRADVDLGDPAEEGGLTIIAKVPVEPEVELGEYKGIEVEKKEAEVNEEEITAEIDKAREANSRLITIEDRATEDGDTVIIDFDGYVDGKQFEGGYAEDYTLVLGSHSFIDNFEDQLVGKNLGEDVEVNVTFPEEYHVDELKGKPALFKVKIKEIQKKELPELDDDFAQDVSDFDTLDEYKADVEKKILENKENQIKREQEDQIIEKIIENAQMEIPQQMIAAQTRQMTQEFAQRLQSQGLSLEQYMQFTGLTPQKMMEDLEPQALKRIQSRLVLEAVVAAENIEASDEEIDKELENMASMYQMEIDKLKELIGDDEKKQIGMDLAVQKAVEFVVKEAVEK